MSVCHTPTHRISSFARMCYSRQIQKTILTFLDRGFSNKKVGSKCKFLLEVMTSRPDFLVYINFTSRSAHPYSSNETNYQGGLFNKQELV